MQNVNVLALDANQALSIKTAQVRVESGIIWLTQRGQHDDVLLYAGQEFSTQRFGHAVIQSLAEGTKISLQPRSLLCSLGQWISRRASPRLSSLSPRLCHCNSEDRGTRR